MEDIFAAEIVSAQIGKSAHSYKIDRSNKNRSPINFFLSHVQKELRTPFDMYWVQGGIPELCLIGDDDDAIIIYNTRYIELVYAMRSLMGDGPLNDFREEMAERYCLRVMAELAVRYRDADWAVRAFLQSIVGQTILTSDSPGETLMNLEMQPISEAYAASWLFGLGHEVGHIYAKERANSAVEMFPPDDVYAAVVHAMESFPYPESIRNKIIEQARGTGYTLSPSTLASEAFADFFAVFQLFNVTRLILAKIEKKFDIVQFISEATLTWPLISILERCKRMALIADQKLSDKDKELALLQPVSYAVRNLLVRKRFDRFLANHIFDTTSPTSEEIEKTQHLVNQIVGRWKRPIAQMEKGLSKAMRFALFPAERNAGLMRQFANEISQDGSGVTSIQARWFCDLAESFHGQNEKVDALRRVSSPRKEAK